MTTQDTNVNGTAPHASTQQPRVPPSALVTTTETNVMNAYASSANFESGMRMAKSLAAGTMVPQQYQGNISNCLIAMDVASRVGASVFAVMQSLNIIHGRPSFSSAFLIASVNSCGRFTPIRFRWEGKPGTDDYGCRAVAKDKETGEECVGTLITLGLAKAEGWYGKNGSKWKTMFDQMCCYRAAAFWARLYAPEMALGMSTREEAIDTFGVDVTDRPVRMPATNLSDLEQELIGTPAPSEPAVSHDADGVVSEKGE